MRIHHLALPGRARLLCVAAGMTLVGTIAGTGGIVSPATAATLTNGGLEQRVVSPWTSTGPKAPTLSVVSTPVHSGSRSLRVTLPVMAKSSHTGVCYPTALSLGTTYTLTAWVRGAVTAQLRVNSTTRTQVAPSGSTWTRLTSTWTQSGTAGDKVCVVSEAATTTAGKLPGAGAASRARPGTRRTSRDRVRDEFMTPPAG